MSNNILPNISSEQQNIIKLLEKDNNVIVESVAGSGKTTTNLYIAKLFPESNILLLTYNAKLKIETRDRIDSLNITNIETHSYHSFCVKYYNNKAYTDTEIIKIVDNNNKIKKIIKYDIIILDELQDISSLYYKLICKIFKDNKIKAKICILGDRYQTIYDFKGADSRYIIHASILFNYNTYGWVNSNLSQSYRITFEMSEFINKCLLKEDRIISHKITNNKPQYIICNTFDDTIFILVKKYLSLGYKPTDIFILAPSFKSQINPVRKLENLIKTKIIDIPVYVPSSDDGKIDSDILKNKLVFSTFHQAKGLERKIVFVYNFDDSYFKFFKKDKNPLVCPNEFYVATTRSSEHLILIHHYENEYCQFVNIDNLKTYCDIQYYKNIKIKHKEENRLLPTSVTQLINHLPEEVLNNCISNLKIIEFNKIDTFIDIPIKIKTTTGYENVSNITGTLMPAIYQYKTTKKMEIFDVVLTECVDFIYSDDVDIIEPIKIYNLNEIDITKENIDELLYISNLYCSFRSGFLFKLYQIEEYNWVTKDNLKLTNERLTKFISINAKYEHRVELYSDKSHHIPELSNRRLEGFIDCIDDNKIYEFKCVHKLEKEHYLQLAIYMYLYETEIKIKNNLKNHIITNKYYLYNILSNEIQQITCSYNEIVNMIVYLIKIKYFNNKEQTDEVFIKNNKEYQSKYYIPNENII